MGVERFSEGEWMVPSICLNMIVKDEAPVIERCLASVKPWIDRWAIVDTGSTDGTQDLVRKALGGLPGELHERPWLNFAHNRNEALQRAGGQSDYLLFIDADEVLAVPPSFEWPRLAGDAYRFECEYDHMRYQRNALVATRLPWRWVGVLHEYLESPLPHVWQALDGPKIRVSHDGARARDPSTYLKDIAVLERAVRDEPGNARYVFYLAQSLRDSGQLGPSRTRYLARAAMGGWEEERWCAQFRAAQLAELLGHPPDQVREGYLAAYQARPTRAEPLYELARYHRERSEFALAHLFAQQAVTVPVPEDILFVDSSVYAWRAWDELAVASSYSGHMDQGREAMRRLCAEQKFPPEHAARIEANRVFFGV
jgi:Glycosyl transferase family 2